MRLPGGLKCEFGGASRGEEEERKHAEANCVNSRFMQRFPGKKNLYGKKHQTTSPGESRDSAE